MPHIRQAVFKTILSFYTILFFTCSSFLKAQNINIPLNRDYLNLYEPALHSVNVDFHSSIKPYQANEVKQWVNEDSLNSTLYYSSKPNNTRWYRKLRKENLIVVEKEDFNLIVNPLLNLEIGRDLSDNSVMPGVNTRGVDVSGSIGDKLSFQSAFYENQATFPAYISNYIFKYKVVPGQGDMRFSGKKFDYGFATGTIQLTPNKHFNIQLGNDKTFIGDGYRSLLLSDNSFPYPYFKTNVTAWKFKYMFMISQFQDFLTPHRYEMGRIRKYGVFHYLSFNVNKRLNVGFFESVIWGGVDSLGNHRGFDYVYLNPVIFLRPVEYSIGSPDNASMGVSFKYKVSSKTHIYGQLFIDEFKLREFLGKNGKGWYANKQAVQIGLKSYNVFGITNFGVQTELNYVPAFTYSHYIELTNYAHYNMPLAHPLGSNFYESINFIRYRWKSFFIETKFLAAVHGQDPSGQNLGNDIFKEYRTKTREYGNYITQGIRTVLLFEDVRLVYIVNPRYNLNVELGISNRQQYSSLGNDYTNYLYFGVRTNLINKYYDF